MNGRFLSARIQDSNNTVGCLLIVPNRTTPLLVQLLRFIDFLFDSKTVSLRHMLSKFIQWNKLYQASLERKVDFNFWFLNAENAC